VFWYYRRRRGRTLGGAGGEADPDADAPTPSGRGSGADGDASTRSAAAEPAEGTDDGEPTAGGGATGDETPEELLSPEERVLRLLERNGGRMKQKRVTEELDWSAARTSQVVGNLRDEGDVESFRLGRENVLKFPDDDDPE
jgi:hypothetical protein